MAFLYQYVFGTPDLSGRIARKARNSGICLTYLTYVYIIKSLTAS